jgi:hypothetical protein
VLWTKAKCSMAPPLQTGNKCQITIKSDRKLGGSQSRCKGGGEGKISLLCPVRNWTPVVQPVAWSLHRLSWNIYIQNRSAEPDDRSGLGRPYTGILGSNPATGMDVHVSCIVLWWQICLTMGWSLIEEILMRVSDIHYFKINSETEEAEVRDLLKTKKNWGGGGAIPKQIFRDHFAPTPWNQRRIRYDN